MTVQRPRNSSGWRHGIMIATAVLLLPFVLFASCVWQVFAPDLHPPDQLLLEQFQRHKAEFQQLLHMFIADRALERVATDFTRPENPSAVGIPPERIAHYRSLFQSLQLEAGIEGYGAKDTIWFLASTRGLAVSGSAKGYVYTRVPPATLTNDLDKTSVKDGVPIYRHIEGNWYLYYEAT
jgi:hypothetical protein